MLEEDIAVLVRAAHSRALGIQGVLTERVHGVHIAHFLQVVVIPDGDFLNLVRSPEAVEEVDKGNLALDGGQMRYRAEVHDFLHVALAEHSETGLTAGQHVGMVAEDIQRVTGHGTCRDMEHAGQQLAGDFIHIGNHEQQTLRGRVGGGHSARGQGAMHGAGRASLGLHLTDLDGGAEDILLTSSGPLIDQICHGRRRGDGVNPGHLGKRVADVCSGVIAVHGLELSCHKCTSC